MEYIKIKDGKTEDISEQDLFELYWKSREVRSLNEIKNELEGGFSVVIDYGTADAVVVKKNLKYNPPLYSFPDWLDQGPSKYPETEIKSKCSHKNKYLNKISNSLQFMYCPECKEEVK